MSTAWLRIHVSVKVFKKVEKQLPQLTTLDLQYVSPELLKARNLELAVPGKKSRMGFSTVRYMELELQERIRAERKPSRLRTLLQSYRSSYRSRGLVDCISKAATERNINTS
jgi:hypothetical protein